MGVAKVSDQDFDAEVLKSASLDDINGWVARKTEGKIDRMLDQTGLPDQRGSDEAADHRIERRVTVVAEVEQAASIGLPRRPDQQETAEHQDECGCVYRNHQP